MSKKCEICGKWLKNTRGYNIHYRMIHGQRITKDIDLGEILSRIRKLELDNSFMKHQLKHKTYSINRNNEGIERIKQNEDRPEREPNQVNIILVIKELRITLKEKSENGESILEKDFRFSNDEIKIKTPEELRVILDKKSVLKSPEEIIKILG